MGLDIHVMRPRRYYLREYELPIRRLLPDTELHVIGAEPLSAFDAGVAEETIVRSVRRPQRDPRYVLPNDNDIYFSEKFSYGQFDQLREFAAFLDHPVKRYLLWGARSFGDGYDLDTLPSLKKAWRTQRSIYPHLVFHEDNRGFYFPTALELPVPSEYGFLGSTWALREELLMLSTVTHKALGHREAIDYAIQFLLEAVAASEKSRLPIVFDG